VMTSQFAFLSEGGSEEFWAKVRSTAWRMKNLLDEK
jgi:hypothetical protein